MFGVGAAYAADGLLSERQSPESCAAYLDPSHAGQPMVELPPPCESVARYIASNQVTLVEFGGDGSRVRTTSVIYIQPTTEELRQNVANGREFLQERREFTAKMSGVTGLLMGACLGFVSSRKPLPEPELASAGNTTSLQGYGG